ncbi:MAG: hypothetical protein ACMG51_04425 [Ginsengibacter sp.]
MELDDYKNTWDELSTRVKVNHNFKLKQFDKLNKNTFQKIRNNIILPETIGSIVCIGFAIYLGFKFENLTTTTFQIIGIVTILVLVLLSVIGLMSILPLYKIGTLNKPYSETLKDFANKKIIFCKLQTLNFRLSYLLLVLTILLSTRLFGQNEITESKYFFIFAFIFGFSFFLIFSKWVAKNYKKSIRHTEELLKDLSN